MPSMILLNQKRLCNYSNIIIYSSKIEQLYYVDNPILEHPSSRTSSLRDKSSAQGRPLKGASTTIQ